MAKKILSNLDIVTIEQLQRLSCSQQQLIVLRLLFSSDMMTAMYQTLKPETVKDLLDCADHILELDDISEADKDMEDYTYLSQEEKMEYLTLVENMRPYCHEVENMDA